MKTRIIGDIHGKMLPYIALLDDCENSIQVGDFGMGFGTKGEAEFVDSMIDQMPGNHRFIRGNHDDPKEAKQSSHYIKDGTIENDTMFIGGADSIDKDMRIEGISWWRDEELSYQELNGLISLYAFMQPKIMVTHTAPISIPRDHMGFKIYGEGSRTELALQQMYETHKPDIWLFGHWHRRFDLYVGRTRFICLNELEYIDLEI